MGPTFPKPWEILSAQASFLRPLQEQPTQAGTRWVGSLPGFLEETLGVLEIRMHFPESSSSCGRVALRMQARVTAVGRGHPRRPCLPSPACLLLPHNLAVLTAQACGSAQRGPDGGPSGRGAAGRGSLVGGWRARPCIYTLGPRLLS